VQEGTRKQGLDWSTEPCMLAANVVGLEVDVFKDAAFWAQSPSSRDCVPQSSRMLSRGICSEASTTARHSRHSEVVGSRRAWALSVQHAGQ